ncbi:hypothetical protein MUK42_18415 [Musa troglodytarum]|uniref:Uncharacterized protein n=1 Tax=Musa troglodytarum TaxID=320322 RepID=A0A9E7G5A4_9LILI|nr:hypothetical protein MUK42_18415 [Musa troglodytarum]URE06150.1 hypothetical protein MUK42_18415 [Musa troglodytarum]
MHSHRRGSGSWSALSASTTQCFRCCSTRQRSSSTLLLGCSSSPTVSSSSKGCCARWCRTWQICTRLGATSLKAMPRVLLRCRLGLAHAWQGWLPLGSVVVSIGEEEELVLAKRFCSLSEHATRSHKRSVIEEEQQSMQFREQW